MHRLVDGFCVICGKTEGMCDPPQSLSMATVAAVKLALAEQGYQSTKMDWHSAANHVGYTVYTTLALIMKRLNPLILHVYSNNPSFNHYFFNEAPVGHLIREMKPEELIIIPHEAKVDPWTIRCIMSNELEEVGLEGPPLDKTSHLIFKYLTQWKEEETFDVSIDGE